MNREELTKIIESDSGVNWWRPDLFEANVRYKLPSELRIILPPPAYEDNYNCFVFTFGLEKDLEFLGGQNPIQKEFVEHIIRTGVLASTESPVSGDFVFYMDKGRNITHGGILEFDEEVVSKWMWGPVIKHGLLDVPSSFGDRTLFFKSVPNHKIKDEYNAYKASGVNIEQIE